MLGDIVRYNFFALDEADKETYSLDYAVVLDIDEAKDAIKILPITNKFCKDSIESFCIGHIPGFMEINNEGYVSNKQYVRFDKIMDVHESELIPVHIQDEYGMIHKNDKGDAISVALTEDQLEKIVKKYRIYEIGEERNLVNLLYKSDAKFQLAKDECDLDIISRVCKKEMQKYREYNHEGRKVVVFFVDGNRYSVIMNETDNLDIDMRNKDLKMALGF
ncbi:hypothetical protein [Peptostreptococcus sp.]|uniref:hypothetical protein n=1 Tax=Peptostreptococcus sp. TaxID=1262 RepID=UPI00290A98BF|nr:hypothetical protein [Peptostreptococcus sp.]MDU3455092.1 hypothetical protein [Peptostreptococcus sp.]